MSRPQKDDFARRLRALDGEMATRIADHPWAATELGPLTGWPEHLRAVLGLMLLSRVPMVLMWGRAGTLLYNDAYAEIVGARHRDILGSDPRQSWPEMAPFHDNVIETCLAGGTLRYRDEMLEIRRSGVPETAWFDLDYSPILDVEGIPVGVLAVVDETTRRVLAARADAEERQQLVELFRQAPSFMAMLSGPDHRFTFLNDAGRWLVGDRAAIGRPVRDSPA